jgi:hypothetical protein
MTTPAIILPSEAETLELRRVFRILYECAIPEEQALIHKRLNDPDFPMVRGSVVSVSDPVHDHDKEGNCIISEGTG